MSFLLSCQHFLVRSLTPIQNCFSSYISMEQNHLEFRQTDDIVSVCLAPAWDVHQVGLKEKGLNKEKLKEMVSKKLQ